MRVNVKGTHGSQFGELDMLVGPCFRIIPIGFQHLPTTTDDTTSPGPPGPHIWSNGSLVFTRENRNEKLVTASEPPGVQI